ncbi:MAG: hypothetical protein FVQ83_14485 [Chloroflexi bacterium]|nr:hypothetical protein [Chloroflexota bacterium]
MDADVLIVVCLLIFIVVGVNATLFTMLRRKNTTGQIELLQRAARAARNPWKQGDEQIKELSRLVSELDNNETDED